MLLWTWLMVTEWPLTTLRALLNFPNTSRHSYSCVYFDHVPVHYKHHYKMCSKELNKQKKGWYKAHNSPKLEVSKTVLPETFLLPRQFQIFQTHNRVGWYQKKYSPTHTHPVHQTSFINFLHLLRSIASSVFKWHAWQSFSTTSLQVLFGLPLGLGPSTSYSMHFFTQSSFCNTCTYHRIFRQVVTISELLPLPLFTPVVYHCSSLDAVLVDSVATESIFVLLSLSSVWRDKSK